MPKKKSKKSKKKSKSRRYNPQNPQSSSRSSTPESEIEVPIPDKRPVPIVVKGPHFIKVVTFCKANNIDFPPVEMKTIGAKIKVSNIADYMKLIEYLKSENIQYHTFPFREDVTLRYIVKNIPLDTTIEDVFEDIRSKMFSPIKIIRMNNRKKEPIPVLLVVLPQTDRPKKFYDVNEICGHEVLIDEQQYRGYIDQCHRCQKFGHTQIFCNNNPRCLKCAESHWTYQCVKPRDTPAKCSNCQGPHPANYSKCPGFPKKPVVGTGPPIQTIISLFNVVRNVEP